MWTPRMRFFVIERIVTAIMSGTVHPNEARICIKVSEKLTRIQLIKPVEEGIHFSASIDGTDFGEYDT